MRGASLAIVAITAMASSAAAQEPSVYIVSVAMEDGLEAVANRAGAAARAALRGLEGVEWRAADQRFLGYDDQALSALEQARTELEAGRQAYLGLELDEAIGHLEAAVAGFDRAAVALEDPQDLGEALLFLGASHAFNGQRRQAMQVFGRLHTQMPHIQPDADLFNPDIIQLYEQSRPRDARAPRGSISVESEPPGAIAYVDFVARGRTPANVDGLVSGEHVVRIVRPGATPFVETHRLRPRGSASSSAYLNDEPGLEGLSDAIDQIAAADIASLDSEHPIQTVASRLELDKIGVIRVSSGSGDTVNLELLLFDAQNGQRLVAGTIENADTTLGAFERSVQRSVIQAFERALRATGASPAAPTGQQVDETPWDERRTVEETGSSITDEWWFWTLIIGGAIVVGAAVTIGVLASDTGPPLGQDLGGQVIFEFE